MWDEAYGNMDPTAFESYALRVAFMMRQMDLFDSESFQKAVKVALTLFYEFRHNYKGAAFLKSVLFNF